jgi:polyhydroxyalkanoate synthesis regulator phasin
MVLDDVRKTFEATLGSLTPAKAQLLAKDLMEPGAAKEQIAKTAADLLDWSQSSRARFTTFIRAEITEQMKYVGVASTSDLDALKKRVRDLERDAGKTASGRARKTPARKKSAAKRTTAKRTTAKRTTAKRSNARTSGNGSSSGSTGA